MDNLPKQERNKIIDELVEGKYPETEIVIIGENRKQLFVRIPKIVAKRMDLKKGQKLRFTVFNDVDNKTKFKVDLDNETKTND